MLAKIAVSTAAMTSPARRTNLQTFCSRVLAGLRVLDLNRAHLTITTSKSWPGRSELDRNHSVREPMLLDLDGQSETCRKWAPWLVAGEL